MAADRVQGRAPKRPNIDDIMDDEQKLAFFMDTIVNKIRSEIGQPMNSFDCIVCVESARCSKSVINVAKLLAVHFSVPYVAMRQDQSLPGLTMSQRFDCDAGQHTLIMQRGAVYQNSQVLLIADLMNSSNML